MTSLATDVPFDGALAAAAERSRRQSGTQKDAHALARFGRGKLTLELYTAPGGTFFGKRESLAAKCRVPLEALLTKNELNDSDPTCGRVKLEDDAHDALAKHGAHLTFALNVREPLRDALVVEVPGRPDVRVDDATWPPTPSGTSKAAVACAERETTDRRQRAPPPNELAHPHAPTLLVSDAVLDAEILKYDENATALDLVAGRLALVAAQQLLHAEVNNGTLTPRGYAARVKDRRDRDQLLALYLHKHNRKEDAAKVLRRVKIADAELLEMDQGGF